MRTAAERARDTRFVSDHRSSSVTSPVPRDNLRPNPHTSRRQPDVRLYPEKTVLSWSLALPAGGATMVLASLLLLMIKRRRREVRRVSVAFDWEVREELQALLSELASGGAMNSARGLHRGATKTRDALLERLKSARYGHVASNVVSRATAEQVFRSTATELRTRYRSEIIDGSERREGVQTQARAEEGRGLVVVSMVVAVGGTLKPGPATMTRDGLARTLGHLVPRGPSSLLALEVIWSPADEQDRMSSAELEALYPELLRLDALPDLGRVRCGQCGAPYAAELAECPRCGAPRG